MFKLVQNQTGHTMISIKQKISFEEKQIFVSTLLLVIISYLFESCYDLYKRERVGKIMMVEVRVFIS